jgi:hypothetical protein
MPDFDEAISTGYATDGPAIDLGRGVLDGELHQGAPVRIPLAMMNRHGVIAGATGTGKTRTLQLLAEALSGAGVPVFVTDVKGDLSGVSVAGEDGKAAEKRQAELGLPFEPKAFPAEYLALGGIGAGVPVRATLSDFGPQLLAKVLGANQTQEQSLGLVFHYAAEKGLGLVDLSDLRALLTYPESDFYDVGELLTQMGIGEAAVTVLSDRGVPTPVVHTRLAAPSTSLDPAPDVAGAAQASPLWRAKRL